MRLFLRNLLKGKWVTLPSLNRALETRQPEAAGPSREEELAPTPGPQENPVPRSLLVRSLGDSGDPRAVEPLLAALVDRDGEVREAAASALGRLGDKRAVEPLLAALSDESQGVREAAAWALGAMGAEQAEEPLLAQLEQSDGTSLYELIHSDQEFDGESPVLLQGTDALVRRAAQGRSIPADAWAGRSILVVPTGCRVRREWIFTLDPDEDPDRSVFRLLQEAEKRRLQIPLEGKLYPLMTSGQAPDYDYNRPIIIKDYAYLFMDDAGQRWHLRVPVDKGGEHDFPLPLHVLTEDKLEETVLELISSVGVSLMGEMGG